MIKHIRRALAALREQKKERERRKALAAKNAD